MRPHKHSPTPLIVPPRSDSSSAPTSADPLGTSLSQSTSQDSGQGIGDLRPLAYPRKSSLSSESSQNGSSANCKALLTIPTQYSSYTLSTDAPIPYNPPTRQNNGAMTPQTAPAGFNSERTQNASTLKGQSYPTMPNPPSPSTVTIPPGSSPNNLLSSIPEGRPHLLSRESRISLPDEAKQYIANMADSPVPSPRLDGFTTKPGPSLRMVQPRITISPNIVALVPPAPGRLDEADSPGASEFLDMNEDEDDDSQADDEQSAVTGPEADDEGFDSGSVQESFHHTHSIPQGKGLNPNISCAETELSLSGGLSAPSCHGTF